MFDLVSSFASKMVIFAAAIGALVLPSSTHMYRSQPEAAEPASDEAVLAAEKEGPETEEARVPEIKAAPLPEELDEPEEYVPQPNSAVPAPITGMLAATAAAVQSLSFENSRDKELKSALVNIYCSSKTRNLGSSTGSGVIVSPQGVILTNAHVAQYFLLNKLADKGGISCVVRSGSPAAARYKASLLYISKEWIETNPEHIIGEKSKGTGEHDVALLLITETADGSPLPSSFPYLKPAVNEKDYEGKNVVLAGYPAEFIPRASIGSGLYALSATSTVHDVYTFSKTTVDLTLAKGSVVAQKGSSGGAMVNSDNELIGIIATAGSRFDSNNQRNLHAITMPYIDRVVRNSTGTGLLKFISEDLDRTMILFNADEAPELELILLKSVAKKQAAAN